MTDQVKQRPEDQALPVPNDRTDIQTLVIADIVERREVGIQRYLTALQPHNGRDAMRDLYEELIDGAMYVKQAMVERDDHYRAGVQAALELFQRMARTDWEGQVSMGFAATFDQEIGRLLEEGPTP